MCRSLNTINISGSWAIIIVRVSVSPTAWIEPCRFQHTVFFLHVRTLILDVVKRSRHRKPILRIKPRSVSYRFSPCFRMDPTRNSLTIFLPIARVQERIKRFSGSANNRSTSYKKRRRRRTILKNAPFKGVLKDPCAALTLIAAPKNRGPDWKQSFTNIWSDSHPPRNVTTLSKAFHVEMFSSFTPKACERKAIGMCAIC